jgi:NADPH-dependent glutamate synthase beta subunit-like oxidoreductase
VGQDIRLADLKRGYNAVFMASGAHKGRILDVENSNAGGVIDGIEFLYKVNTGGRVSVGDKVVVVGGGNVAVDVAATAIRLGAGHVRMVCLENREEMPALDEEIKQALEEGIEIDNGWGPKRILASGGAVTGIELQRCLACYDQDGQFRPVYDEKNIKTVDADMVITAIGEVPDLSFLSGILPVDKGLIKVDPVTLETDIEGVFAGGDCVTGAATVIQAMAAGRKAAKSIDKYLRGEPLNISREGEAVYESRLLVDTWGTPQEARPSVPVLPLEKRHGNFKEVVLGLTREEAIKEAKRCLGCDCKICINLLGCPALITEGGEMKVDATQCPGCGVCAQVCPFEAIVPGE